MRVTLARADIRARAVISNPKLAVQLTVSPMVATTVLPPPRRGGQRGDKFVVVAEQGCEILLRLVRDEDITTATGLMPNWALSRLNMRSCQVATVSYPLRVPRLQMIECQEPSGISPENIADLTAALRRLFIDIGCASQGQIAMLMFGGRALKIDVLRVISQTTKTFGKVVSTTYVVLKAPLPAEDVEDGI